MKRLFLVFFLLFLSQQSFSATGYSWRGYYDPAAACASMSNAATTYTYSKTLSDNSIDCRYGTQDWMVTNVSASTYSCTAGVSVTTSYIGTGATYMCLAGCKTSLSDSVSASADGGLTWSTGTTAKTTGETCAQLNGASDAVNNPPTCPAGQTLGTVNGVYSCQNSGSSSSTSSSSSSGSSSGSGSTTSSSGSSSSGSGGSSGSSGGSSASGSGGTGTDTSSSSSSSSGGSTSSSSSSSSGGCSSSSSSGSGSSSCAGTGASTSDLYTKGTRTLKDSFTEFKDSISQAPIVSSATTFLSVGSIGAGSCPSLSFTVPYFGTSFSFDYFCSAAVRNMLLMAKAIVLLAAAIAAFKICVL